MEPRPINGRWMGYFKELLNVGEGKVEDERDEENSKITEEELDEALKKMKNGKSTGSDGIVVELMKEGGTLLKNEILSLLNKIWGDERIPEEWGKTVIVPIYKGKKTKGECMKYRGISLINHAAKIHERILEKRIRTTIEPQLGEEQYGYRRDRSTIDLVFAMRIVIEKSWEYKRPVQTAFIDHKKALNSVPRAKLWKCLDEKYGVRGRLKRFLMSLYQPCTCNV